MVKKKERVTLEKEGTAHICPQTAECTPSTAIHTMRKKRATTTTVLQRRKNVARDARSWREKNLQN